MTTETGKAKKTKRKELIVQEMVAEVPPTLESCNCGDQIKVLELKVEVLAQYMRTFNVFLNQNMISNTIDHVAEVGLTEVMDMYPAS